MEFVEHNLLLTLVTLTFLEIILGIDNLIFIALVVQKLPQKYRKSSRIFGLALAFIIRFFMLLTLSWVMTLTKPLFSLHQINFSFKDILLFFGGLFLIFKSGLEIIKDISCSLHAKKKLSQSPSQIKDWQIKDNNGFFAAVIQISLIDFVFSFDSVITAIAMTDNILVIIIAVVISMIIMFFASGIVTNFLTAYPSLKIVALSFIFMVGIILFAESLHFHINKAYLYFALFFTLAVESLNIVARNRNQ
jgi:predicted tellurium resistance membrane protein TerC